MKPGSVGPCTGTNTPSGCKNPDADTTAGTQLDGQAANTYDDELLDAHFTAGDGRVNENIALTTVHQIFHSEHDRLVADIKQRYAINFRGSVHDRSIAAQCERRIVIEAGRAIFNETGVRAAA